MEELVFSVKNLREGPQLYGEKEDSAPFEVRTGFQKPAQLTFPKRALGGGEI